MSGELEDTIARNYLLSASSSEEADALYDVLSSSEGVEIQHRYRLIPAIAARIEDNELVQRLMDDGYRVEEQHLFEIPTEKL